MGIRLSSKLSSLFVQHNERESTSQKSPTTLLSGLVLLRLNGHPLHTVADVKTAWNTAQGAKQVWTTVRAVKWEEQVKLLGVRFDSGLTFTAQFEHVRAQHSARIGILRRLAGSTWGCTSHTLRMVYKVFGECTLTWGLAAWGPLLSPAQSAELDEQILRAAKLCYNLPNVAARNVALYQADLLPFSELVKLSALRVFERMVQGRAGPLRACAHVPYFTTVTAPPPLIQPPLNRKGWYTLARAWLALDGVGLWARPTHPEFNLSTDIRYRMPPEDVIASTAPWVMTGTANIYPSFPGLSRKKDLRALAQAAHERVARLEARAEVVVYTDGAASHRDAVGGYVVTKAGPLSYPKTVDCAHAGLWSSSYVAEQMGVLLALKATVAAAGNLLAHPLESTRVLVLFTDSHSLLRKLQCGELRQSALACRQIWIHLRRLQVLGWLVTLQYVPSHLSEAPELALQDIAGNAAADAAVTAAQQLYAEMDRNPRHFVFQGTIVSRARTMAKEVVRAGVKSLAWYKYAGHRRLHNRNLTRAGEEVVMGFACGQHVLLIPGIKTLAKNKTHNIERHCPHCLKLRSRPKIDRTTAHCLLYCPTTNCVGPDVPVFEHPMNSADKVNLSKLVSPLLLDPAPWIAKLIGTGELPGVLSDYVRVDTLAPD